jgi:DNA-binding MarR family transcriptional regulator
MPEDDRVSEPDQPIGYQLYLAHRFARAAANRALKEHGIDLRHLGVLGELARRGPCSQRQLIDAGQLDKSSMVHVVDDLERAGLAGRERDPNDRRAHAVRITDAGRQRLAAASATANAVVDRLLTPFTGEERRTLHDLLARFIENAQEHR